MSHFRPAWTCAVGEDSAANLCYVLTPDDGEVRVRGVDPLTPVRLVAFDVRNAKPLVTLER